MRLDVLFPRLVGGLFAAALLSTLVQYEGLSGATGLEPAGLLLSRSRGAPTTLLSLAPWVGLSPDVAARVLALAGFCASVAVAGGAVAGGFGRWLLLAGSWVSYSSLLAVGGTFSNFQWDALLLELGWGALLAVPFTTGASTLTSPGVVLLRFALFKLMFQSGAVKLTAGCPTWDGLTATEVHFASQPLPTPLAWFAHAAPPIFQRLAVATTLWIELPGALLLLWPTRLGLSLGLALQALLQVLIFITGNYNFFNAATIALLVASLPSASLRKLPPSTPSVWLYRIDVTVLLSFIAATSIALFRVTLLPSVVTVPATEASIAAHFAGWNAAPLDPDAGTVQLLTPWWSRLDLAVAPEFRSTGALLGPSLDALVLAAFCVIVTQWLHSSISYTAIELRAALHIVFTGSRGAASSAAPVTAGEEEEGEEQVDGSTSTSVCGGLVLAPFRLITALITALCATLVVCGTGVTLAASVTALATLRTQTLLAPGASMGAQPLFSSRGLTNAGKALRRGSLPPQLLQGYNFLLPFRAVSSYGLFRRMTGVGPEGVVDAWALPVTSTARPELVLEGWWPEEDASASDWAAPSISDDVNGTGWRELPFPYKPGPLSDTPAILFPHAPRLDWQLWFPALSDSSADAPPWLFHLCDGILEGDPSIYSLLIPPTNAATAVVSDASSLGWPVTRAHGGLLYAVPPTQVRISRVAYDFTRPFGATQAAPWVIHRHLRLSEFFKEPFSMPPGFTPEAPSSEAAATSTPSLHRSTGLWAHPAITSVVAVLPPSVRAAVHATWVAVGGALSPWVPTPSPWWQRANIGDASDPPYLAPVARNDEGVTRVLEGAGWGAVKNLRRKGFNAARRSTPGSLEAPRFSSAAAAAARGYAAVLITRGSSDADASTALPLSSAQQQQLDCSAILMAAASFADVEADTPHSPGSWVRLLAARDFATAAHALAIGVRVLAEGVATEVVSAWVALRGAAEARGAFGVWDTTQRLGGQWAHALHVSARAAASNHGLPVLTLSLCAAHNAAATLGVLPARGHILLVPDDATLAEVGAHRRLVHVPANAAHASPLWWLLLLVLLPLVARSVRGLLCRSCCRKRGVAVGVKPGAAKAGPANAATAAPKSTAKAPASAAAAKKAS